MRRALTGSQARTAAVRASVLAGTVGVQVELCALHDERAASAGTYAAKRGGQVWVSDEEGITALLALVPERGL